MANIVELREMGDKEITDLLESAREELFNLRFQKATGSLENTARMGQVRQEIARLSEILRKRSWAVSEIAGQPAVAQMLEGKTWSGSAHYDYEQGVWLVAIVDDNGSELASGKVDLNKKRRRTRRQRDNILPVEKVISYEVAS